MSNKHKHYEIGVAKLENTELCVFYKLEGSSKWESTPKTSPQHCFYEQNDYFLCLPQHNENGQCLHWLNGGEVESIHKDYEPMTLAESGFIEWSVKSTFMKDSIEIRIKPKKEKRWILHVNGTLLTTRMFTSEGSAKLWIEEFDRVDEGVLVSEIETEVEV